MSVDRAAIWVRDGLALVLFLGRGRGFWGDCSRAAAGFGWLGVRETRGSAEGWFVVECFGRDGFFYGCATPLATPL